MTATSQYVSFDQWLHAAIKGWHPEYDDERVKRHVGSLYTAAQCFPDDDGEMPEGAKAQVMNCLKIWRSYDYQTR